MTKPPEVTLPRTVPVAQWPVTAVRAPFWKWRVLGDTDRPRGGRGAAPAGARLQRGQWAGAAVSQGHVLGGTLLTRSTQAPGTGQEGPVWPRRGVRPKAHFTCPAL